MVDAYNLYLQEIQDWNRAWLVSKAAWRAPVTGVVDVCEVCVYVSADRFHSVCVALVFRQLLTSRPH